jgi:2-polyprenyl-6-methoxyphenol hydroxylase-like FAD-dependent oxidoreductase
MMPNSMKVLRGIGIEERVRKTSFAPYSHLNRDGYTGEVTRELPMPESLYDAPYLCMHRADLHDALASAVSAEIVHLGKKLVGLDQTGGQVTLHFEDGTSATADAVWWAQTACTRLCVTWWSALTSRSTKAALPIAPYFPPS